MSSLPRLLRTDPIEDDDDAIGAALSAVSVPALIASVVHITGDPAFIRGPNRPREFLMNEFQGRMTEEEKTELRDQALKVICAWRDAGCPPVEPLSNELIREVMDWIACEHVPADYAAMFLDEMDLAGEDPRAIRIAAAEEPGSSGDFSVIVVGCGESGLLAGIRLKQAGIDFQIIEKNDDVGGTWLENTYPGCRVDVGNHYYCYSFEPNHGFSEYYSRQPELYRYFRALLDQHGVADHVRWGTEMEGAVWDDATARWQVRIRGADGTVEMTTANAVISAVGLLNRPFIPDLPNLDRFAGPVFHSARWDHSVDLRGKRVALVGAGASGFQIGPAIVDEVERLVVFQRTAQWMAPNPRYHARVEPGEKWAMYHLPGYARWYRFMLLWQSSDKLLELVRIDPDWPDFPRTANSESAARRKILLKWIERQVGDDPELLAKVTPDYPPMAKRMLQDNGSWLRCLKQPHVDLVKEEILDIGESSIVTAYGSLEVDVIILATGFRASEVLSPLEIVGRDRTSLTDKWGGKPAAYRGISIPGFPNFFILGGPGTGLAHAGSLIFTSECQMRYIGEGLRTLLEGGHRSIEVTTEAYEHYNERLQAELSTLMWGHSAIKNSWYKAADGNIYILSPWRLVDYWKLTGDLDRDDHVIR